jgi:hypothetical protein
MPNSDDKDLLDKVQTIAHLVLTYERLNQQISQLLTANDGSTENMSRPTASAIARWPASATKYRTKCAAGTTTAGR